MTPFELKRQVELSGKNRLFFTRNNMKFAGDTMKNYGVKSAGKYWELYRKCPVKNGLQTSAYFDKITFGRIYQPKI